MTPCRYSENQKMGKKSIVVTVICMVLWAILTTWLIIRSGGSYLPAWFVFQSVVLILLILIGTPRTLKINDDCIYISCYLQLITIDIDDIVEYGAISASSRKIPLLSTMGFISYIGYYYYPSIKKLSMTISRSLNNLVYAKLKSGRVIVFSISNFQKFSNLLSEHKAASYK